MSSDNHADESRLRRWLHKGLILLVLAIAWELYARWLNRPLVFPTFLATVQAFYTSLTKGDLLFRTFASIRVLLLGYACGIGVAIPLTLAATASKAGTEILETLSAMFNPLPAIALLPLALLWFGIGSPSMIFVLVHATVWPVALNAAAGFAGVSDTLRMVGRNYGLSHVRFVTQILAPAAFPNILTGLKVSWAFAWRTLIAAELVFGASSSSGGLGWFIYENKNQLETAAVFAGLGTVIIIGVVVENLVFRTIEEHTIRKWGMKR
jgi:NitT/TauT family transport system permease protein